MFKCDNCGTLFDEPRTIKHESYIGSGMWEKYIKNVCPICCFDDFEEVVEQDAEAE